MTNKEFVAKIAELAKADKDRCQSQASTQEQLRLLVYIGNAVGLYDAVDAIKYQAVRRAKL